MKTNRFDLGVTITENLLQEVNDITMHNLSTGAYQGALGTSLAGGVAGAATGGLIGAGASYLKNRIQLQQLKQEQNMCQDPQCKERLQIEINNLKQKIWSSAKKGAAVGLGGVVAGKALKGGLSNIE